MKRSDRGSAFIEALVGSAIVSMAVLSMLGAARQSVKAERSIDARRMASLIAQSELATVGTVIPLRVGTTTGSDGAYAWRIDIAQSDAPALSESSDRLFVVSVSVGLDGVPSALLTLRSERVGGASG